MTKSRNTFWIQLLILFTYVSVLAYFFANVEIANEGFAGWAADLPTWRIEKHWALDLFWGGRAMTGYHAWVFPFIALFFHSTYFFLKSFLGKLNLKFWPVLFTFGFVKISCGL